MRSFRDLSNFFPI